MEIDNTQMAFKRKTTKEENNIMAWKVENNMDKTCRHSDKEAKTGLNKYIQGGNVTEAKNRLQT